MINHSESKIIGYSSEQMFHLVCDVEKYHEFIPWCRSCRIISGDEQDFTAEMIVGYKGISDRFISRVKALKPLSVEIEYIRGPMKDLHNSWYFAPMENQTCRVDFNVSFSFRNRVLNAISKIFIDEIIQTMTNAFEKRARDLYG